MRHWMAFNRVPMIYAARIHASTYDPFHASTDDRITGFWPQSQRTIVSQFGREARQESTMTVASEGAIIDGYTEAPSYAQEVRLQPSVPVRRSSLVPTYATIAASLAASRNRFLQ